MVGQQHIVGKDKLLYRAIQADKLGSIIFTDLREPVRPPCKGHCQYHQCGFRQINATVAGKKDMEEVVKEAKDNIGMYGRKTILFVDEIHRFNKGQQDYLLPLWRTGP